MKTIGKIITCIIIVLLAIGIAYFAYNGRENNTETSGNTSTNTNVNSSNDENKTITEIEENKDYIGEEENKEEPKEEQVETNQEQVPEEQEPQDELTGKDKAIDIVKKQYALEGQIVRYDHMEGTDYIIKINDGTAVTWYIVNGTTWEAEEY